MLVLLVVVEVLEVEQRLVTELVRVWMWGLNRRLANGVNWLSLEVNDDAEVERQGWSSMSFAVEVELDRAAETGSATAIDALLLLLVPRPGAERDSTHACHGVEVQLQLQ